MRPAPPPPTIGSKFREVGPKGTIYEVRAIIDFIETPEGPVYVAVMRYWSKQKKTWYYEAHYHHAFAVGFFEEVGVLSKPLPA